MEEKREATVGDLLKMNKGLMSVFLLIIDAIRNVFLVSPLAFILGKWNVQSIHQHAVVAKEEDPCLIQPSETLKIRRDRKYDLF